MQPGAYEARGGGCPMTAHDEDTARERAERKEREAAETWRYDARLERARQL